MPKTRQKVEGQNNLYFDDRYQKYIFRKYSASLRGEVEIQLRAKTLKQACLERDECLVQMGAGEIRQKRSHRTFGYYFGELLNEVMTGKAQKTFIDFETIGRLYLLPYFKYTDINRIGPMWEKYKTRQRLMTPGRKLHHDRKHLIRVLRYANRDRHLMQGIPELPLDREDKAVRTGSVYSPDEVRRLLNGAKDNWKLIVELAVIHGLRIGEILKLRRENFKSELGFLELASRSIKTREPRIVPLEGSTAHNLRLWLLTHSSPYVFPHRDDPSRPMKHYNRSWERLKRRAGISGKTFHDTRHTSVTWALELNHNPKLVQKTRGMSPQVMDRIYVHSQLKFASKLNTQLRKKISPIRVNSGKTKGGHENALVN